MLYLLKKAELVTGCSNYIIRKIKLTFPKINHQKLGKFGIYNLWRIQKSDLNKFSRFLVKSGYKSDWENRKVEKF